MSLDLPAVPALSKEINSILNDEQTENAYTALIVSLSMLMKRRGESYDNYVSLRESIMNRLLDLTNLSKGQFIEEAKLLRK